MRHNRLSTFRARCYGPTAQVDDLKRALLSSQQASIAAQEHVAIVTNANAQFKCAAFQREVARSTTLWASLEFSLVPEMVGRHTRSRGQLSLDESNETN